MERYVVLTAAAVAIQAGASVRAQSIDVTIAAPVVDRWMYPFGSEAGTRATVPLFGSQNRCGPDDRFDDLDSQLLITFATDSMIEPGWPAGAYRLSSATLTVRVSDLTAFAYDPTPDAIATFFGPGDVTVPCDPDPAFVADGDAGRPVGLFGAAFRNGFTAATYGESSPFKPGSAFVPPWIGVRNAYPITMGAGGAAVDASNPIKARELVPPLATGTAPGATPGQSPADGTEMGFAIEVGGAGVGEYLGAGLSSGRVALLLGALFEAQQQQTGLYPNIYTKEAIPLLFPNAAPPRLAITLFLCKADFSGDGELNADDLSDYITAFFSGEVSPAVDFNRDGERNADDLSDYITAFFTGCP